MLQTPVDPNYDHIRGKFASPVTLVEYGDFHSCECCSVYNHVQALQKEMNGELKFIFRHFPEPALHPLAMEAAIASEIAATQSQFWKLHDSLFELGHGLSREMIFRLTPEIDLNKSWFTDQKDLVKLARKVVSDFESGIRSGVRHSPAFFINGLQYNGPVNLQGLLNACRFSIACKTT